jgi:hypothetical protein
MTDQTEATDGLLPRKDARRAEAVGEERRRRKTSAGMDPSLVRFGVTADILDQQKYVYRAAEDRGMRIHTLTQDDDYDFVTLKGEGVRSADAQGVVRYQSGTVDGKPIYSYLLRKLKKFADEDRAERIKKVDAEEKARLTETPEDAPDKSYSPRRA